MKTIIFSALFLSLWGCSRDNDSRYTPQAILPVQISQFHLMGSEGVPQQTITLTNSSEWEELKNIMGSRVQHFSETEINFDEFIILAVFDQVYPNGGNSIDITNVMEHQSNISVTVERLLPGGAQAMIQQPYHIVKIPITDKPVVFEMSFED